MSDIESKTKHKEKREKREDEYTRLLILFKYTNIITCYYANMKISMNPSNVFYFPVTRIIITYYQQMKRNLCKNCAGVAKISMNQIFKKISNYIQCDFARLLV